MALATQDSGVEQLKISQKSVDREGSQAFSTLTSTVSNIDVEARSQVIDRERMWKKILCPPRGLFAKYMTWTILLCAVFGAIWSLMPERLSPKHDLFDLVLTILFSFAAEQLVIKIPTPKGFPSLPPLLASLLMGLALRNLPAPANIAEGINADVSNLLRKVALTVILTRAGLEIDPEAMKKVKWAMIRLAFTPCIGETLVIGVLTHFILGFPWVWSFMTGFLIAAVSPAVVVPCLIILQARGYGVSKGVPSLVMAASGIDDVLAITGFTILLGIAIPAGTESNIIDQFISLGRPASINSPDTTTMTATSLYSENYTALNTTILSSEGNNEPPADASAIGKEIGGAVLEVAIGILSGLILGILISYFPAQKMKYKNFSRGCLLLCLGIFFVFGTTVWSIPGAGTLCAIVMSFTASLRWKEETAPLAKGWHQMWKVFQPILFGLTGTLVDVSLIHGPTVALGLAVLGCALVGRLIVSTLVTFGLNFNLKEKLFVSIAWIPKGTVQAALCSAALDQAIALNRPEIEVDWGRQILNLAVLITLITAPVGSFGISLSGPKLLVQNSMGNPNTNEAYEGDSDVCSSSDGDSSITKNSWHNDYALPGVDMKITDPTIEEIESGICVNSAYSSEGESEANDTRV